MGLEAVVAGGGGGGSPESTFAQAAHITTSETTASATYVDLTTAGPSVTVTIGPQGVAIVFITWGGSNTGAATDFCSVALSSGNTVAATDNNAIAIARPSGGVFQRLGGHIVVTGLTVASTVFKVQYRTTAGTATFNARDIAVITY